MRPQGAVSFVEPVKTYRFAVEVFALARQEGDRSERGVLESPTTFLPVPCWSPDQQAEQVKMWARPKHHKTQLANTIYKLIALLEREASPNLV